jgi:GNAT superfamily N-acetyltransferase
MTQTKPLTLSIRAATAQDRCLVENFGAALQEFERGLRPSRCPGSEMKREYAETLFRRVTHQDGAIFLAEAEGRAVGILACHVGEDPLEVVRAELIVSEVWVVPELRSRGVFRTLLAAAREHARVLGLSRLIINALFQNESACATYESHGFRRSFVTFEFNVEAKK